MDQNRSLAGTAGGSSFPQQGTVDWAQMTQSTLTFSIGLYSRLANAGVDVITLAMAQTLCANFCIPAEAQDRIIQALAKLKALSSFGDVLWFGFGVKHIIRSMAESEQGLSCVALCGCLSVSYSEIYAAQVLRRLALSRAVPDALMPSIYQWRKLVRACSGSLLASDFPNIVEGFARLWSSSSDHGIIGAITGPTTSEALGKAIDAVSHVADGSMQSITVIGGNNCAWIAAIAEWVFSLRVEVRDEDDRTVYRKFQPSRLAPQVLLVRAPQPSTREVIVSERTYYIPSGSIIQPNEMRDVFSHGRSSWTTIFHDTFGPRMSDFLRSHRSGKYIAGELTELDQLRPLNPYILGSSAANFALNRFPELRSLPELTPITLQNKYSPHHWREMDSDPYNQLPCTCRKCGDTAGMPVSGPAKSIIPGLCDLVVAKTVVEYIKLLIPLQNSDSIQPSSTGLAMLYKELESKRERPDISPWKGYYRTFGIGNLKDRLRLITGIGSSGEVIDQNIQYSAVSCSGITAFLPVVQDPYLSPEEHLAMHLIPGHILHNETIYDGVCDLNFNTGGRHRVIWDDFRLPDCYQPSDELSKPLNPTLQLVVKQTTDEHILRASYVWKYPPQTPSFAFNIPNGSSIVTKAIDPVEFVHALDASLCEAKSNICNSTLLSFKQDERTGYVNCHALSAEMLDSLNSSKSSYPNSFGWVISNQYNYRKDQSGQILRDLRFFRLPLVKAYSFLCSQRPGIQLRREDECIICPLGWFEEGPITMDLDPTCLGKSTITFEITRAEEKNEGRQTKKKEID